MWIEQFGKQNKKILFLSLIPMVIGLGIFVAYNFQAQIPFIQAGVLCLSIICVLIADNKNFNSKILLFKSGSKYYNIESLEENENNEYARESLFRVNDSKEEKKGTIFNRVYICAIISLAILFICGISGLASMKLDPNFNTLIGIPAVGVIINCLIINSYNCVCLPYSIIFFYILAAVLGNLLTKCTCVEYGFILCITLLFTQILLLILSKLDSNNRICGLGFAGYFATCGGAVVNYLINYLEEKIMYCMCLGVIFACVACYYKIQAIKELEKKRKDEDKEGIELQDIDHN
jgi:hypothetical protein